MVQQSVRDRLIRKHFEDDYQEVEVKSGIVSVTRGLCVLYLSLYYLSVNRNQENPLGRQLSNLTEMTAGQLYTGWC